MVLGSRELRRSRATPTDRSPHQPPLTSRPSPAGLLAGVLLLEPALQRREVLEDRRRVHLARAGELGERVLPGLARAERQHLHVGRAGVLVAVDRALVERALVPGLGAQRLVKLEL